MLNSQKNLTAALEIHPPVRQNNFTINILYMNF